MSILDAIKIVMPTLIWALCCPGQVKQRIPDEVASSVDAARSAIPEAGSLALLRIIKDNPRISKEARIELTRQAFEQARSVFYPHRLAARKSIQTDSREGYVTLAMREGLDRLSLQTASVEAALAIIPAEAKKLFEEVELSNVESSCATPFTPDQSSYARVFAQVFQAGFAPKDKEIEKGDQRQFARMALLRARSLSAIDGMFGWLSSARLPEDQKHEYYNLLLSNLDEAKLGPRDGWVLDQLLEHLQSGLFDDHAGIFVARLATRLRALIVDLYNLSPCDDVWKSEVLARQTIAEKLLGEVPLPIRVVRFNSLILHKALTGISPVEESALRPKDLDSSYRDHRHWESAQGKRMMDLMRQYNAVKNPVGTPIQSLRLALDAIKDALGDWSEKQETFATDFLAQKSYIQWKLIRELPVSDPLFSVFADDLGALLRDPRLRERDPAVWYFLASRVSNEFNEEPAKLAVIRSTFLKSGDPTLALLAMVPAKHPSGHK